jgi:hypothetical protein
MTGAALPAVEAAAKSAGDAAKGELDVVLPILRGRANMDARRRAERDRNLATALEAYDQFGTHDPRWDDAARDAIRAFAWPVSDTDRTPADHERRLAAFKKALDAGCRDPLILYFHPGVLGVAGAAPDEDPVLVRMKVAQGLLDSGYPPERKVPAALRFVDATLWPPYRLGAPADVLAAARADMDKALELFPEAARRADAPTAAWIAQSLIDLSQRREWNIKVTVGQYYNAAGGQDADDAPPLPFDRKAVFDRLYPAMQAAMPGRPEPLVFKGRFYTEYAWDARGGGYADTVTEEGCKGFYQRLALAEQALTRAYELDPTDPDAATWMLQVVLGGGGKKKMETPGH